MEVLVAFGRDVGYEYLLGFGVWGSLRLGLCLQLLPGALLEYTVSSVRLGGVKREPIRTIRFTPRFKTSPPTDFKNSAGSDSSPSIIVLLWEKKKTGVGPGFHVSSVLLGSCSMTYACFLLMAS